MTAAVPDPFGAQAAQAAPAPEEAQQQTPPSDPWQSAPAPVAPPHTIVQGADGKVVLTFKGGGGFEAPWVVVHASNLDEALSYVTENGAKLLDLFNRVQTAATAFRGGAPLAAPSAPRQSAPAAAAGPPPGSPAMPAGYTYVTKVKNGRPWHGYFPSDAQKAAGEQAIFFDPPK